MKKILLSLTIVGLIGFSSATIKAQGGGAADATEQTAATEAAEDSTATDSNAAEPKTQPAKKEVKEVGSAPVAETKTEEVTGHAMIKKYFIQGDWKFMSPVLICLILGLGIAIGRIIVLMLNWINVKKFISQVEKELQGGNTDKAKEVARSSRGPIASIYFQGLDRAKEGIDIVEKSIVSYGSVQMGLLEKGLVWISLFISLAPMLGFLGTVIGMILAFDQIEAMGDIQPSAVAGGIKVALLTTVAGLIVAIILQFFYNLITSIVDSLVNKMEDASITLVDMMIKYGIVARNKDNK